MTRAAHKPPIGLVVLAAHLGLALWVIYADARRPESGPAVDRTAASLIWLRSAPAVRRDSTTDEPKKAALKPSDRPRPQPTDPVVGAAIHPPLAAPTVEPAQPAVEARSTALPSPPEPPASAPLDLRLPRRLPANAGASEMARGAHQPRSLDHEQRLARDLGTDTRVTESVTPQGRRYVSGLNCTEIRPSRASQLDPFNASTQPMPKLASRCAAIPSPAQ